MKARLFVIGLLVLAFVACNRLSEGSVETRWIASPELSAIDSLMWRQPDSALAVLQQFVASPQADNLDLFNGHYCQLLISELLYKNDYEQSNRPALQQAVAYFDSLTLTLNDTPTSKHLIAGADPLSSTRNDIIIFLTACAHYINGVGYYEHDSVVEACKEYMKALEVMYGHFTEKELVGEKSRFIALTYTHLTTLFSDLYLHEQTIYFAQCSLPYYRKQESPSWNVSWVLTKIGTHFDMMEELDSANCYYKMAMTALDDTNTIMFRDIAAHHVYMKYRKDSLQADATVQQLKKLVSESKNNTERLARCAFIGELFYHERQFDSAWHYLNLVYCETPSLGTKKQAAELLVEICKAQGRISEMHEYAEFLVPFANQEENKSGIKSQLTQLFNTFRQSKTNRQLQIETNRHLKQVITVVGSLICVVLTISILYFRNKRHKQKLEVQIETERNAHKMQQSSLSNRLKRSNEELRELKDQIRQQTDSINPKQEAQAMSFNDEPICRLIMERVNDGQFKAKIDCEIYKQYALDKQQLLDLRVAADRHFAQFTIRLRKAYPRLTSIDIDYCCLNLLNLTHADISALMQRAYNTVVERDSKIQKVFDTEKPLHVFLMDIAQHHSSV